MQAKSYPLGMNGMGPSQISSAWLPTVKAEFSQFLEDKKKLEVNSWEFMNSFSEKNWRRSSDISSAARKGVIM